MIFDKKEVEADRLLGEHFEIVGKVLDDFKVMFQYYVDQDKRFKDEAYRIHKMEHDADMIRRDIQLKLHQGAYLPIYREDYVQLAEKIDTIANGAEAVGDYIVLTRPRIPEFAEVDFMLMVDKTHDTYEPLRRALNALRKDMDSIIEIRATVGEFEQDIDRMLWDMTKRLFKSELDLAWKLHVKMLYDKVANISNRIEDLADHFEIMVIKRKF